MKSILIAALMLLVFTSCEKEDDPVLLSDYIIAEWMCNDLGGIISDDVLLYGEFFETHYTLYITNGDTTIYLPDGNWSVDNSTDILILDDPEWPGTTPNNVVATFKVFWDAHSGRMLWLNLNPNNEGQEILWHRQSELY